MHGLYNGIVVANNQKKKKNYDFYQVSNLIYLLCLEFLIFFIIEYHHLKL